MHKQPNNVLTTGRHLVNSEWFVWSITSCICSSYSWLTTSIISTDWGNSVAGSPKSIHTASNGISCSPKMCIFNEFVICCNMFQQIKCVLQMSFKLVIVWDLQQFIWKSVWAFIYVLQLHLHKKCNTKLRLKYLHVVNVNPTHAAAAINEEDKFAVNLPQVRADRFEVWTKVQHDHGVVEDVLMESPVYDIYLITGVKSKSMN